MGGNSDELVFSPWRSTFEKREYADLESLRLLSNTLDRLRLNRSKDLVAAARAIGDGLKDEGWRLPFGETGILDVVMNIIASPGIDDDLAKQSLRIVGNSCIDTDANRERVVARNIIPSIIAQLQNEPWLALPVLNNIIADYEPAQEAVRKHGLCTALASLLVTFQDGQEDTSGILPNICLLLDVAVEGEFDTGQCADSEVEVLLKEASDTEIEVEEFGSLIRTVVAHLKDNRFQKLMVTQSLIPYALDSIVRSYPSSPFHGTSPEKTYAAEHVYIPREPKDEDQLRVARNELIAILSDVSATPEFAEEYPVDSTMVKNLCVWLSVPEPSIQLCACLMLGNLARSDAVCKEMVRQIGLHELLVDILVKSDDLQLLHATLGFLRNLALRVENKGMIAATDVLKPLSRIWSTDLRPQLQYGAVRVVRQLITGSLANIQRLLTPLAWDEIPNESSYLAQLLALFSRTDDITLKFEISRIIAAIWRCVRSPASTQYFSDIIEGILPRLHSMAADLAKALAAMVTQSRWLVVKSEGWFALALIARSKEGSDAIVDLLREAELSNALIEVIGSKETGINEAISTEPDSAVSITEAGTTELRPEQQKDMETKDRDNALVLVSEVLKNSADHMPAPRRDALERSLRSSKLQSVEESMAADLRLAESV